MVTLVPAVKAATTLVVSVTSALASIAFSLEWSASVNVLESVPASTAATISALLWSAVAPASIPSSLSNIALDITPPTLVVATGIVALVPSELVIITVVVLVVIPKSVDTFVTLTVLSVTAVSKSDIFGIATVPVNVGLAIGALSANAAVIVLA